VILRPDRHFLPHTGHRREPAELVMRRAIDNVEEAFLYFLGNGPAMSRTHLDPVNGANRRHLRRCASEEHFVGNVE
jgi:hypothetical protein